MLMCWSVISIDLHMGRAETGGVMIISSYWARLWLAVFILGLVSIVPDSAAQAQRQQSTAQGVNGYNVARANFDRGSFRKTGNLRWTEYNARGRAAFTFTETGRDEWSVYLNDRSRNVQIQIDIHRMWITYGANGGPKSDLYRITRATRQITSNNRPSSAVTNGRNVQQVFVPRGSFKAIGGRRWAEYNAQGRQVFTFTETGRDEWSVYLNDRSRNVQLQLDLYRKWVTYGTNGGSKSDLYRITSSSRQRAVQTPTRRPQSNNMSRCKAMVQNRVAWNRGGNTRWAENNLNNLCRGTTNPSRTIACFEQGIRQHGSWQRATRDCKGSAPGYRPETSRPSGYTRDINAGPIWNQQDAETKCPAVAASQGGEWNGQWRTTIQGKMSVCGIRFR